MVGTPENSNTAENGASDPDEGPVVVAIGASAGGVQALQALLSVLPEHTGASFVVI